ncbi:MAG: hypothetical protein ABID45_03735 [Patescibacteria group bacterium]
MTIKKGLILILIVFTLFILINKPVLSESAIGVSPSKLIVEVEQGSKTEQKFNLNRSETNYEARFEIHTDENSPYIDLQGREELILPPGVEAVDYSFFIDTTQASLGEHENILYFCLIPSEEQKSQGVAINFCLGPKVIFTVVEASNEILIEPVEASKGIEFKVIVVLFIIIALFLVIFLIIKKKKK